MIRRLAALAALVAMFFAGPAPAQDRVVLVASAASPLMQISSSELRKIYLGIEVSRDGHFIRGLRNASDPQLTSIFLQTVVGLSADRYERRLLSNVLKYGTLRPAEFTSEERLAAALEADPYAVSYMWLRDGQSLDDVKTLRVLWQSY